MVFGSILLGVAGLQQMSAEHSFDEVVNAAWCRAGLIQATGCWNKHPRFWGLGITPFLCIEATDTLASHVGGQCMLPVCFQPLMVCSHCPSPLSGEECTKSGGWWVFSSACGTFDTCNTVSVYGGAAGSDPLSEAAAVVISLPVRWQNPCGCDQNETLSTILPGLFEWLKISVLIHPLTWRMLPEAKEKVKRNYTWECSIGSWYEDCSWSCWAVLQFFTLSYVNIVIFLVAYNRECVGFFFFYKLLDRKTKSNVT